MAGLVVLDAGALIALHNSEDPHHNWAVQMLSHTIEFDLAMSALTYAEVLVHPTKAGKAELFVQNIDGLGMTVHETTSKDAIEISVLRVKTGLKMPDVVVLQLAAKLNASLATTDKALASAARTLSIGVFQPN